MDTDSVKVWWSRLAKSVMLMGTSSNVGKSVLCTGLCRIFQQEELSVAPFKSQNMSLNSAVTPSGREIGRAQAAQAEACGIPANEHMNPVLLKPNGYHQSQVVLQGQVYGTQSARQYFQSHHSEIWAAVIESYDYLAIRHDVIVIEGAGSPVEMNLKAREIANMKTAEMADASVILVADIDRGGIFASVVGTMQLLTASERARVKGVIVNKFRGDPTLFEEGVRMLETYSGVPVLGVLPYIDDIGIDEEDSVAFEGSRYRQKEAQESTIKVAIVHLPHLSNFTDFDALFLDSSISASFCKHPREAQDAHAIILPGTKNTMEDLRWLRETQWISTIRAAYDRGVHIFGICGGYQILGQEVLDPTSQESSNPRVEGIGLLPIRTTLQPNKITKLVHGHSPYVETHASNASISGYEIHMGSTEYLDDISPFAYIKADGEVTDRKDGAIASNGRLMGTYLHGVFDNDDFRAYWLNHLRSAYQLPPLGNVMEAVMDRKQHAYDRLAEYMRMHLNLDLILSWVK